VLQSAFSATVIQMLRKEILSSGVAVVGTGVAFAFLEAGAFRNLGAGTWQRMTAGPGLQAAALGAGATALLLAPGMLVRNLLSRRGTRGKAA
jgi:hypothetical protein